MKTTPLPETINPSRLALSQQEISGDIKVSSLHRILELLASDEGELHCSVHCDKDEQGRLMISGDISATLMMNCQLCLQSMTVELEQSFKLLVVSDDDEASEVIENYEPIEVINDRVQLKQLFEDEALLALPFAPSHHKDLNCLQHENFAGDERQQDSVKQVDTKQPFADLKSLMGQSSDEQD